MYVEGTGPGPYEGGHVQVLGSGKVLVVDRADLAGAGPRDGVRADRGLRARGADRGRRGDHRRHPALRLRRRHVRLAGRGDERQRDRAGRAGRAGEGAADRGRRPGGLAGRPGDRRGPDPGEGRAGDVDPAADGRRAVQPAAVRVRRGGQAGDAVREPHDDTKPPVAVGRRAGAGAPSTTTRRSGRRSRRARTRRSWRSTRRRGRSTS